MQCPPDFWKSTYGRAVREALAMVEEMLLMKDVKAMTKIREYFLLKINQFKKPLANYQIPQNAMLSSG